MHGRCTVPVLKTSRPLGFWVVIPSAALLQGMMEGGLSAAGMRGGQTPQISANYAFDMNTSLQM